MRQNITHNYITYALLTGLLVCGFVFVATPVMAQETAAITQNANILGIDVGYVTLVIVLAVGGALGTTLFRMNGRISKIEGILELFKDYFADKAISIKNLFSIVLSNCRGNVLRRTRGKFFVRCSRPTHIVRLLICVVCGMVLSFPK